MIAVLQRVARARVTVGEEVVGAIGPGLVALVGVRAGDDRDDARILADRVSGLRIFEDQEGRMNLSCVDLGLEILAVSQFTLCADLRRGRRPGFEPAERPERAETLLRSFVEELRRAGLRVAEGRFGASMDVALVNRGPATFVLDSALWKAAGGG